ncbi:MYND-type domain-containing protein [Mycena indigotica]|uniref:MYND-type domain-containing protein n=1 Tax=Mycena indigotica TaxID=2126181 RepID=A0A8H6W6I5_9AGAR|nr:MYND-type domain-containing protein [Mycena indigotica]KAF7303453.1 MYND-type domain-containing protein [Mycena indigotica]
MAPAVAETTSASALFAGELGKAGISLFLYGIYLVLFFIAVVSLTRRPPQGSRRFMLVSTLMTFPLATVQATIALACVGAVVDLVHLQKGKMVEIDNHSTLGRLTAAHQLVLAVNNLLTDIIFLHRCLKVWGRRRVVLAVPIILMTATLVVGISLSLIGLNASNAQLELIPFTLGLSTTLLLAALTGGRIWWMQRALSVLGENALRNGQTPEIRGRYTLALKILIESGAIYSICALAMVISIASPSKVNGNWTISHLVIVGIVQQGVNIVPMFVAVRVGWKANRTPRSQAAAPANITLPGSNAAWGPYPQTPRRAVEIRPRRSDSGASLLDSEGKFVDGRVSEEKVVLSVV